MNTAIVALLIATAPTEIPPEALTAAVTEITETSQTGSLMFSKGDCLAVRAYTNSPYTHVATIVYEDPQSPVVYDSMNGPGVRKLPLRDYLETQSPDEVQLFHPCRPFATDEQTCYRDYLESELGRPYSVKHHITGKRAKGVHCAEYVTDALEKIDWLKVDNPPRVSPASLVDGIIEHDIYSSGSKILIPVKLEPIPEPEGFGARLWLDTKICMKRSCGQLSRWFLCQ